MKFVCDACERIAEVTTYRVENGALYLQCARCHAESTTTAAPSAKSFEAKVISFSGAAERAAEDARALAATEEAFRVPEGHCPKCVAKTSDGAACPHCGLTFALYRPDQTIPSPELAQSFREALARWSEPPRHEAFLQQALALGELPSAGRLYRIRQARFPEDPIAQKGCEEVMRLAQAQSMPLTTVSAPPGLPVWLVALAAALGVLLTVTVLRWIWSS